VPTGAVAPTEDVLVKVLVEKVLVGTFVAKPELATKLKLTAEPVVQIGVH
jgi:hypothetical protein